MILDNSLISLLTPIGENIMKSAGLSGAPSNMDELYTFIKELKRLAEANDNSAALVCHILYSFVTSEEVRDRHTSPREFEDIFGSLFGTVSTDSITRTNPTAPDYIKAYDVISQGEDWTISTDLSGNKREKADVKFGTYELSLKTLKGKSYDANGTLLDNNFNNEINVGSFSYRALFKGILSNQELQELSDRKRGLGSGPQMRKYVLDPIKAAGKNTDFRNRLHDFLSYVYSDDVLILIKSNYQITFYLVPSNSFVESICTLYDNNEAEFQKVWYRWENNNLRFPLNNFINNIKKYNLTIQEITIDLSLFEKNQAIKTFKKNIEDAIRENISIITN